MAATAALTGRSVVLLFIGHPVKFRGNTPTHPLSFFEDLDQCPPPAHPRISRPLSVKVRPSLCATAAFRCLVRQSFPSSRATERVPTSGAPPNTCSTLQ